LVRVLGLERASDGFELPLDSVVLVVAVSGALLAGLLSALLPLFVLLREDLAHTVQEIGRADTGGVATRRWRSGLVVAQLAAAVALLVGAGLLMSSFYELQRRGPGFQPAGVWSAAVALPSTRYADDDARARFFELTLAELRSLPGVDAAGFTTALPFSGQNSGATVIIDGYVPADGGAPPTAQLRSIDEEYFVTLGIPIVRGRNLVA